MPESDRELLEMAAKAAGMEYRWEQPRGAKQPPWLRARLPHDGDAFPVWNPLTDDGDAFRPAVKLQFALSIEHRVTLVHNGNGVYEEQAQDFGGDPYAATRRAIVRAAASLSKESPHA